MIDEMNVLHMNYIRDFIHLSLDKTIVRCGIYPIKEGLDGHVDCLKACIVAKVYTQIYGFDYVNNFSPGGAKMVYILIFPSMAAM